MSILNLGVLNSIKKGIDTLIKGGGKNTNSQSLTLAPGVQTATNVFDISDVNAIIAIKQFTTTPGGIECIIRYHDENGEIIFVGETKNFLAQSVYEQAEVGLESTRVSFRLTNQGSINKTLTISLNKSASTKPNVVNLFGSSLLELAPGVETLSTKTFEFDTDYVRIGFYGLSGTFPANLEILARYTTPTGDKEYIFLDPGIVTEVKNGYNEGILYKLKHRKVSFRFRNISPESFTLSRIVASKVLNRDEIVPLSTDKSSVLTRGKPVQQLFTDNVISLEPEDTSNFSNILEVDADYGVIGMYGLSGSFPAVVEITPRYHGRDYNIIYIGDPILVNVGSMHTGKVAAVVPMIHKKVSFRIVNKSPETISIAQAVISPRYTDPNGNNLNFPLSPDGAMLVQLMDGVDSGAFDSFYGSLKSLRTYKNDFKLIVAPPTVKQNAITVVDEFTLQDGVEQLRLYLKLTVTGSPFPNAEDGVSLAIKFKDGSFDVFSITGDKIKTGTQLLLFGDKDLSSLAIPNMKSFPAIFGDSVNLSMQVTGTLNTSDYITYEIVSYQKFK